MKFSAFILTALVSLNITAQSGAINLKGVLGSARNDLYVFSSGYDSTDGSHEILLCSLKLPLNAWVQPIFNIDKTIYSERRRDWDWTKYPAYSLLVDRGGLHLSKYDDNSAFSADWGIAPKKDGSLYYIGTILRYQDGHFVLKTNALDQARIDYGLTPQQDFLGMVGNNIFYYDNTQSGKIYFYEKGHQEILYEIKVNGAAGVPRSWRLDSADQVFLGENTNEILVMAWFHHPRFFLSRDAGRRWGRGISLNMKSATLVKKLLSPIAAISSSPTRSKSQRITQLRQAELGV